MDLPRLKALAEYHRDNPPLHQVVGLLGRYFGVLEQPKQEMTEADFDELMAAFPQSAPSTTSTTGS